jgi:hypothetical protein
MIEHTILVGEKRGVWFRWNIPSKNCRLEDFPTCYNWTGGDVPKTLMCFRSRLTEGKVDKEAERNHFIITGKKNPSGFFFLGGVEYNHYGYLGVSQEGFLPG